MEHLPLLVLIIFGNTGQTSRVPMSIRETTEIQIKLLKEVSENADPRCEIVAKGVATGSVVPGAYLEAAVQWGECHLLFLTNDCPFEETLNIYLFDKQWRLLDSAEMFYIYSTGSFSDLKLTAPNRAQFRFFGDTDWELEIFDAPQFRFPWLGEPVGVIRGFGFTRHFLVRGSPKPTNRL